MKALITGITGQDGSYLAEYLLHKGYEVHGIIRRSSTFNTKRIDHIYQDPHNPNCSLFLHYGDVADSSHLARVIQKVSPNEVYHLAAQSHVRVSFDIPEYTGDITGLGTTRVLEAIRHSGLDKIKFYQASSSELFGSSAPPQNEETKMCPQSPYAAAKLYSYWMVKNYRDAYGMFASNGILFNHESPRRGETFVTRKITRSIANMMAQSKDKLYLGNLDSKRDWGFAPEYVELQWQILQQEHPDDYVIGMEEYHSVREFVEKAFEYIGVHIAWEGKGEKEKGIISKVEPLDYQLHEKKINTRAVFQVGSTIVEIDPKYFRPTEVASLLADASKAKKELSWKPRVSFVDLIQIMLFADTEQVGIQGLKDSRQILHSKGFPWLKRA